MARVALFLSFALLATACGGDGNTADEPSPTTTTSVSVVTTTSAPEATTSTSAPAAIEPTLTDNSSLSTVGLDTVTFGLTVRAAEAAAGTPFVPEGEVGDCYRVHPEEGPEGVTFMVTDGTIERIDVDAGLVSTRSGFGIGTPARQILDAFGDRITVESSPGGGQRLVFTPADEADQAFRVIFDTDGTTVTALRAGRIPMVEWDACPE